MLAVDFIFDTMCPWCYVGLVRLHRALQAEPGLAVRITYLPFMIDADIPANGIDRGEYQERKFGGSSRVARLHQAACAAGAKEGIDFNFDAISLAPNTLKSHRMIRYADGYNLADSMVLAIFRAYFTLGQDIGNDEVLANLAADLGMDRQMALEYLASSQDVARIRAENQRTHRLGVNGVPCAVFGGKYAISGAHEPEILAKFISLGLMLHEPDCTVIA